MTEQLEYVQKRLELLDAGKIQFLQKKTAILNEEILSLQNNLQDVKAISHNKDAIEDLYASAIKVK